jgi:radical SAM protein with 4Fe4S-binding SPASM domain
MSIEQTIHFVKKFKLNDILKPKDLVVYLKTTETCQLNCKHCFTNGINGKKIYFDAQKTIDWFHSVYNVCDKFNSGSIIFHGGEPFLAPLEDMYRVWEEVSILWPNISWSCSTNLSFNLTDKHLKFFKTVFKNGFCTSWDKGIRFSNEKQENLWRKNLAKVVEEGHNITLNVSLNRELLMMDTGELVNWLNTLGVNYVQFERLTHDGSALNNTEIFPMNKELDAWFIKMHESYQKIKPKYKDVLLEGIYTSFDKGIHGGVRCRDCEQKIFTLNADGGIAGCPNAAVGNSYGHINMPFESLLTSAGRINNITCETQRDSRCYSCDVFDICNSDCHQLQWQDNICAAPKSLMKKIKYSEI